jgi:RNA recognition motif-containing protein
LNIYVGNLPKTTNEDAVRKLFEVYGEVTEVKLLKDQYTEELRGFGFITIPSKDDALKAIEGLNSTDFEGRALIVNEAKPRKDNRSGGGGRRGGGGGYNSSRSRSW